MLRIVWLGNVAVAVRFPEQVRAITMYIREYMNDLHTHNGCFVLFSGVVQVQAVGTKPEVAYPNRF